MQTFGNSLIRVVFLFLFLFPVLTFAQSDENVKYEKGLYFRSNEAEKDDRTSLDLTPCKSIEPKNGFSMSFDIKLRPARYTYGYIFRVIANDSLNIDLISMDMHLNKDLFSLVIGNKSVIRFNIKEFEGIDIYEWINVRFTIDPKDNQLTIIINNIEKRYGYVSTELKNFNIFFGANSHHLFATTDVSTMTIRNIKIYNNKDKIIRSWELGKHGCDVVYDSCKQVKAIVKNPVWEMDSHIKWTKKATLVFPFIDPQIAFDDESGRIFFTKNQSVFIYNVVSETIDTLIVKKGVPYDTRANQMIYDKNKKELISYNFDSDTLNRFDFEKREWEHHNVDYIPPRRWHHSKVFIPEENMLFTIGGYGFYEYKKDIFTYSISKGKWEKFHADSTLITPRYLGGLGYMGDGEFLYFGGLGNISGRQDELPQNYYDLFKINIKDNSIKKLWTLKDIDEHFVNGNSLVIDKNENVFYSLTYPDKHFSTQVRLYKFNVDAPEFQFVADTIAFRFNDNESYCDLFYYKPGKKLIAVTAHSRRPDFSEINIYAINYPPLRPEDVWQKNDTVSSSVNWIFIGSVVFVLLLLLFIFQMIRKKKGKRYFGKKYVTQETESDKQSFDKKIFNAPVKQEVNRPSSINLLGGLQIINSEGDNITNHFTTILGQIFLLSLLYTIKNGKGITTPKLIDAIWSYKDDKKARNNLYVNINKLRPIIKTIGDVEFTSNEGIWSVTLGDNLFCDYKNVISLIKIIDTEKNIPKDLLNELLDLSSKGNLLPNFQWECLDNFKSEYTNLLVDKLSFLMEQEDIKKDLPLLLKTANVALICDSIDENALAKKCYALYHLGKKRQAKESFEKFKRDYMNLLGTEYKSTFDQFMEVSLKED